MDRQSTLRPSPLSIASVTPLQGEEIDRASAQARSLKAEQGRVLLNQLMQVLKNDDIWVDTAPCKMPGHEARLRMSTNLLNFF